MKKWAFIVAASVAVQAGPIGEGYDPVVDPATR